MRRRSAPSCEPPAPLRAWRPTSTSSTSREQDATPEGDPTTQHLEVGVVVKPHGLKGDVIVELFTNRTERLDAGNAFNDGALIITRSSPHQQRWIVAFEGVESIAAAEQLRGTVLRAAPIDDPDALWVHDLIGARVLTADGLERGTVEAVQANPASDLLVLDTGALVPARFVVEQRDGDVIVDVPDGLFDDAD